MNKFVERWIEIGHNKINEVAATFTSGALVADGIDDSWTLADWSTLLGMIYVASMLIPRIIEGFKWLKTKWRGQDGK